MSGVQLEFKYSSTDTHGRVGAVAINQVYYCRIIVIAYPTGLAQRAQFNIHEAKTNFSRLLEMAERGEEVVIARNGNPVAQLIPIKKSAGLLGAGVGDPSYRCNVPDEEFFRPMSDEEIDAFVEGRL